MRFENAVDFTCPFFKNIAEKNISKISALYGGVTAQKSE